MTPLRLFFSSWDIGLAESTVLSNEKLESQKAHTNKAKWEVHRCLSRHSKNCNDFLSVTVLLISSSPMTTNLIFLKSQYQGVFSFSWIASFDRLCGQAVRVLCYRSTGPGFDSRSYQIFWEVEGLGRCKFSFVSTTEELLGRNSSGSGLENREHGHENTLRWPRDTLHMHKLTVTSPTSGVRSVGIVRSRTQATELLISSTSNISSS
jgi:hypothetical protein